MIFEYFVQLINVIAHKKQIFWLYHRGNSALNGVYPSIIQADEGELIRLLFSQKLNHKVGDIFVFFFIIQPLLFHKTETCLNNISKVETCVRFLREIRDCKIQQLTNCFAELNIFLFFLNVKIISFLYHFYWRVMFVKLLN